MLERKQSSILESFSKARKTTSSSLPTLEPSSIMVEQVTDNVIPSKDHESTSSVPNSTDNSSFVNKHKLSDEERYTVLTEHFTPNLIKPGKHPSGSLVIRCGGFQHLSLIKTIIQLSPTVKLKMASTVLTV